jgi:hypothetical protein
MARWQLQCSGRAEEAQCKFCMQTLPNWRETLFKDVMPDDDEHSADTVEAGGGGGGDASMEAALPASANPISNIKGDIIVKFNGSSFRCKVGLCTS